MPAAPITAPTPTPSARGQGEPFARPPLAAPILVATAGDGSADAALAAARVLAGRTNADVRIVSVVAPSFLAGLRGDEAVPTLLDAPRRALRETALEAQLRRAGVADAGWPVEIAFGSPARVIAARARTSGARLVVIGRSEQGPVPGWYGAELALRLLRLTDVPVLVASTEFTALPRRVLLALDFSPYSVHAGRIALSLAAPDALVHLVHVRPRPLPLPANIEQLERDYARMLPDEFARARGELGGEDGHQMEPVTLGGDPVTAIVDYATEAGTELLVAGAHGRGFLDRVVLGSVAGGLLHRAPCSVLCVPGSALAHSAQRRWRIAGLRTHEVPRAEWGVALAEVTRRGGGRACTVEVDRPEVGAQRLVEALPLVGADYDAHGDRVTVTLGAPRLAGRHLTHVVPGVTAVDLVTDDTGAVQVLRIGDREGQTLVTFTE